MPVRGRRFIIHFLLPSLDDGRFGNRLCWRDAAVGTFQLLWSHKSTQQWTEDDARVFTEWDRIQGHYQPSVKNYFSRSKQRFRAVLYKLMKDKVIKKVNSNDKAVKIFCIVNVLEYSIHNGLVENVDCFKSQTDKKLLHDDSETSIVDYISAVNHTDHSYANQDETVSDLMETQQDTNCLTLDFPDDWNAEKNHEDSISFRLPYPEYFADEINYTNVEPASFYHDQSKTDIKEQEAMMGHDITLDNEDFLWLEDPIAKMKSLLMQ